MDLLQKKELDTSRGFHYRYYVSSASDADSSKPAILLCHGWPDSADLWQYVIPQLLKTKNRLIVPDLLGAGGTSQPTDPAAFEIKGMVQDVQEILKAENISQKIIPVGHDWGSYFAQRFYMLNGDRNAGVATLNVAWMAPRGEPFDLDAFNDFTTKTVGYPVYAYWELFADPKVGEVMDDKLESVWHAIHGDEDEWMKKIFCEHGEARKFISANRTDVPLKPYAKDKKLHDSWIAEKKANGSTSQCAWYRALKEDYHLETEKTLNAKVTTPYLFIACDEDAVCRPDFINVGKQAGLFTDDQLTVRELHSGHWCPYEKPDEVADALLEWLRANDFSAESSVP
ncbi:putative alpha/beta hydrolase-1, epoxide hydrolase [Septoria linicola]|nr:putative alpha/beta hydrolase-1, epoxide hydrolase [Septoria linicola]